MADKIRILIADDHEVVRKGLALVLRQEPDFEIIGEAHDGPETVQRSCELYPDVLLLDFKMPGMNGAEVARRVCQHCPQTRFVILSGAEVEGSMLEAMEAVDAYLSKDVGPEELTQTIRAVAAGKRPILSSPASKRLERMSDQAEEDVVGHDLLSPREKEVLQLMATAMTYREIGQRLFISEETVRTHAKSILTKLGQPNRTQAVVAAVKLGLITLH
ncbi:MAG: response regulator transcription factor [Anaerolineales bacterium]|nr:response regulator transcription factor [Anaerolineales bacterium]